MDLRYWEFWGTLLLTEFKFLTQCESGPHRSWGGWGPSWKLPVSPGSACGARGTICRFCRINPQLFQLPHEGKFPCAFSPPFELNIYFNSCPPKTSVKLQMFWEQGWLFPLIWALYNLYSMSLLITWPTPESKEDLSLTGSPRSFLPRKPFLYIGLWHFRYSIFLNFHLIGSIRLKNFES